MLMDAWGLHKFPLHIQSNLSCYSFSHWPFSPYEISLPAMSVGGTGGGETAWSHLGLAVLFGIRYSRLRNTCIVHNFIHSVHAIVHAPPISAPEVRMLWERSTYKSGIKDPPAILFMTILKPSNWESMWSLARFHAILGPKLNTTHTHTPLQIYVIYQCKGV